MAWPQLADGHATKDLKYRFQWNAPIVISPQRPDGRCTTPRRSSCARRDEGETWEEMSPDLTRNDKAKQGKSGGPITIDVTGRRGVRHDLRARRVAAREGRPLGRARTTASIHVTRDDGKTWQNVTPKGIPEWIQINAIDVSPHDKASAYVAATMYKFDDFRPYLYKTNDYGKTWTKIVERHSRRRLHARRARGPGPPRPALRRHGDGALRLLRRRGELAAVPAEPAGRARHGPHGQGRRPRRRDAGPLVLDPGRPDAAAALERPDSQASDAHLFPPRPVAPGPDGQGRTRRTRRRASARTGPTASSSITG